ncbi:hypothetical protein WCP94_002018 [Bilophila wadsworthia]
MLEKACGEGKGNLSGERFPFPSPHPTPSSPKTFALIESLFTDFPVFQEKELRLFFLFGKDNGKAGRMEREREREREEKPSPESSGEGLYLS